MPPDAEQVDRHRQRNERSSFDRHHPVAHCLKGRKPGHDRAETDQAGDTDQRQNGRIGAGIDCFSQGGETLPIERNRDQDARGKRNEDRPNTTDRGE